MITFRHGVSEFKNLLMVCEGQSSDLASAAASALMNAAARAVKMRNTKRTIIKAVDGIFVIRCEYNQHTAEIAMTTICGFEWLAQQMPDMVTVERISARAMKDET